MPPPRSAAASSACSTWQASACGPSAASPWASPVPRLVFTGRSACRPACCWRFCSSCIAALQGAVRRRARAWTQSPRAGPLSDLNAFEPKGNIPSSPLPHFEVQPTSRQAGHHCFSVCSDGGLPMMLRGLFSATIVAICIAFPALAEPLPTALRPEPAGLSAARLKVLDSAFQAEVDSGKIPGAVVVIVRNGRVAYSRAFGYQDREKQVMMKPDAIFRIASMTKPLVSVAVMMLVEEGKLQLISPVSAILPEFKGAKVGVEKLNDGKPELVLEPAQREMTIHDLLRHTSGLTSGRFGNSLVTQAYRSASADIGEPGVGAPGENLAAVVSKVSRLPLAYQPGTTFE